MTASTVPRFSTSTGIRCRSPPASISSNFSIRMLSTAYWAETTSLGSAPGATARALTTMPASRVIGSSYRRQAPSSGWVPSRV